MGQKNNKNNSYLVLLPAALLVIVVLFIVGSNRTEAQRGDSSDSKTDPVIQEALVYYYDKVGDEVEKENVEAVKKNFGCHFEIHIYYEGELVMRLGYSGGRVYEI